MLKSKLLSIFLLATFVTSHGAVALASNSYNHSSSSSESTGQYLDDSTITAKVKSAFLANKYIKSLDISVTTNNGVVTLTGNVKNAQQEKKAIKVASKVKGVKSVNNELSVNAND